MYQDYKDLLSAFQSHGVKYLIDNVSASWVPVIHQGQTTFDP
jgi:hypothetical protein